VIGKGGLACQLISAPHTDGARGINHLW